MNSNKMLLYIKIILVKIYYKLFGSPDGKVIAVHYPYDDELPGEIQYMVGNVARACFTLSPMQKCDKWFNAQLLTDWVAILENKEIMELNIFASHYISKSGKYIKGIDPAWIDLDIGIEFLNTVTDKIVPYNKPGIIVL